MTEENNPAPEAGDTVLPDETGLTLQTEQPEAEKPKDVEKPEPENVEDEGQDDTPPAEDDESPDEDAEKKSPSKERRERRKAYIEQLKAEKQKSDDKLARLRRATEGDAEPKEDDFQDLTEYTIAKAAWTMTQKQVARESEAITEEASGYEQQRRSELAEGFKESMTEARGRITDFDDVIKADVHISEAVVDFILESDQPADLAYAIASRPQVSARLAKLSVTDPVAAAREIGRLEASLSQPKPRTQSSAPEPIRPVNARGASSRSPEAMSYTEYKKARAAGTI